MVQLEDVIDEYLKNEDEEELNKQPNFRIFRARWSRRIINGTISWLN